MDFVIIPTHQVVDGFHATDNGRRQKDRLFITNGEIAVMKSRGDRVCALENELGSELAGERTRHKHATGRDEAGRFTES
jgi:hypothetical protein